jgi:hypothetical protein
MQLIAPGAKVIIRETLLSSLWLASFGTCLDQKR